MSAATANGGVRYKMKNRRQTLLKRLFLLAVVLCPLLLPVNAVHAALVTYSFTGDVDTVNPLLSSTFNTGQNMSGSITVNTSDTNVNPLFGNYAVTNFSLNIGGYTATIGSSGQVEVRNGLPGLDRFNVTENAPNGSTVNFLAPRLFEIQLRGPASVFNSDALPTTVPSISSFSNSNQWRLVFGPGNGISVRGDMASLTAVPLPAAVILFGAGLVALVGLGAGGLRNLRRFQA